MTAIDDFAASLDALPPADDAARRHAATLLVGHLVTVARATGDPLAEGSIAGSRLDRDDVHWGVMVHPGAIVWPTVLRSTAGDRLRAARVGYETMVRLGSLLRPLASDGFHLTSLVGPAGSAAAASVLLEGRANPDALAHALSVAGGSSGALIERSGTRAYHRAHAIAAGTTAARAAADGVRATREDLERGSGLLPRFTAGVSTTLTTHTAALEQTSIRPWPTSGWNQAAWEAAVAARRLLGTDAESATVEVPERVARASSGVDGAEFDSLERAVAGVAGCPPHSVDVATLTVGSVGADGARVTVRRGAATAVAVVEAPPGHPLSPLSDAALSEHWALDAGRAIAAAADWLRSPTPERLKELGAATTPAHPTDPERTP